MVGLLTSNRLYTSDPEPFVIKKTEVTIEENNLCYKRKMQPIICAFITRTSAMLSPVRIYLVFHI